MAIVTRYFSTAAAGAGDGTTWADRAALFSAGNWSSVVTGFAFNASDSLEIRVEGALSYTCGQSLASGLFTNPPSAANPLFIRGCDNAGALLDPPDPDWMSAQGAFSTSTLPVIATTTNIQTLNLANVTARCVAFTASGRTGGMIGGVNGEWISVTSSTANVAAIGVVASSVFLANSQVIMSGASFSEAITCVDGRLFNVRVDGSAATTSGNRYGINTASAGHYVSQCTVIGCAGGGIIAANGSATRSSQYYRNTIVNSGAFGIQCNGTASQTVNHNIMGCYISGSSTYGIEANGSRTNALGNRLRDNTSGNFNTFGNYPTDSNYTTDSDDATEFVDPGAGDYRIKNTAAIWGKGYGAGDEISAGGGGSALHLGSLGQTGIGAF